MGGGRQQYQQVAQQVQQGQQPVMQQPTPYTPPQNQPVQLPAPPVQQPPVALPPIPVAQPPSMVLPPPPVAQPPVANPAVHPAMQPGMQPIYGSQGPWTGPGRDPMRGGTPWNPYPSRRPAPGPWGRPPWRPMPDRYSLPRTMPQTEWGGQDPRSYFNTERDLQESGWNPEQVRQLMNARGRDLPRELREARRGMSRDARLGARVRGKRNVYEDQQTRVARDEYLRANRRQMFNRLPDWIRGGIGGLRREPGGIV